MTCFSQFVRKVISKREIDCIVAPLQMPIQMPFPLICTMKPKTIASGVPIRYRATRFAYAPMFCHPHPLAIPIKQIIISTLSNMLHYYFSISMKDRRDNVRLIYLKT